MTNENRTEILNKLDEVMPHVSKYGDHILNVVYAQYGTEEYEAERNGYNEEYGAVLQILADIRHIVFMEEE